MSDSPLGAVLDAIDALDLEGALRLFASGGSFMTAFGTEGVGIDDVRQELNAFLGGLRAVDHVIQTEWHPEDGVWFAEVVATYDLEDFSRRGPYRRAIVVRSGDEGITSLRIYGAHEQPLNQSGEPYSEVRGPHGWLPTL